MRNPDRSQAARADWDRRIGRRGVPGPDPAAVLPPPARLRAVTGRGHVTLDWDPVPEAAGYLVYRDGPALELLDHRGGDVLAVPAGPYADTSAEPGRVRRYAVAAVADGKSAGPLSAPVAAAPSAGAGEAAVTIEVGGDPGGPADELERPWEPMIGSEHLSSLLCRDRTGGRVIGTELSEALRIAHDELGVQAVRAHGILCDDLGVYTESDGRPVYDFSGVDRVYDELLAAGLRPVVELSFMPGCPGPRSGPDGLQLRGDRIPAIGLGTLGRPGPRPGGPPGPSVRPGRGGIPVGVRGLERAEPGGVLVRHASGVLPAL